MSKLKHLQKLTIWNNNLTAEGIAPLYELKRLKVLDIRQNSIEYISPKIKTLTGLSDLTLSSNPLSKLPVELRQLRAIHQLGLGDLPEMDWVSAFSIMENLPNLRRVGMYSMRLPNMPAGFDKLKQVEVFWMNSNSFDKNERARIKALLPNADVKFD
ncbi:leucine-rich repeat domain-containing protein [Hymenobacter sp. BT523]|uniref:leucine-rich repeat domain-containing protein n=1 Tax=Hymenobacter sp. BT523 TaxID=2795725 RepID=UPI0018EA6E76|nr:leucine-rich repeat domain-containing protein [Hymenobacter sp. BT523]MBJ6110673.1 leucine-rich repeat domain-containing protein [Hymenobacter sp. BT523]